MLKNQLHATATQVSTFRLLTAIPVYFAFVFGLARDHWNPFGLRDRGFFLIFAPATAAAFIWMAFSSRLLPGTADRDVCWRCCCPDSSGRPIRGLLALVGQEKLMSGRLSVLWNIVRYIPTLAGAFASGYISGHLPPRPTPSSWWRHSLPVSPSRASGSPRSVFSHAYEKPQASAADFVGKCQAAGEASRHLSGRSHHASFGTLRREPILRCSSI